MALPQNDRDLIREFEQETLDLAAFHHADHVRLARAYLLRYSLMQVLARFPNSLKTLATRKGHPEIYHETITCAYIVLIHDRMQRGSGGDDWASFSRANPDLLNWAEPILNRYYLPETLKSEKARGAFVVPDRDLDAPQVSRRCSGS